MEETLKQILNKLDAIDKENKEFRQEVKEKLTELDNKTEILLTDIKGINRKLDRQSAKLDIISATVKEHEIRIEDLEELKV